MTDIQAYAVIVDDQIVDVVRWDGVTQWAPTTEGATVKLLSEALAEGLPYGGVMAN